MTMRPAFCSAPIEPSARARRVDNQLPLGGNAVAQNRQVFAGNVRPGQIEFIFLAVVGAVPDQDQGKFVFGLCFARDLTERIGQARLGRVASRERVGVRIARRGLEKFVEIFRQRRESLLVVRLAAEARNGDVVRRSLCADAQAGACQASGCKECAPPQTVHTTPHFRRSSHSVDGSSSKSRKTIGIFHNSLASRTLMPASE